MARQKAHTSYMPGQSSSCRLFLTTIGRRNRGEPGAARMPAAAGHATAAAAAKQGVTLQRAACCRVVRHHSRNSSGQCSGAAVRVAAPRYATTHQQGRASMRRFRVYSSSERSSIGTESSPSAVEQLKLKVKELAEGTAQGVKADAEARQRIDDTVQELECINPTDSPGLSEGMGGNWVVRYSDAPPPSNGVLGPFLGMAYQNIDLEKGTYENLLKVGGDEAWLRASLIATWDVLDGTRWKVYFQSLSISLLGVVLFSKRFEDVTRIWKFTYLDEHTRVMRAGRTGRGEDDVLFFMERVVDDESSSG